MKAAQPGGMGAVHGVPFPVPEAAGPPASRLPRHFHGKRNTGREQAPSGPHGAMHTASSLQGLWPAAPMAAMRKA